MIAPYFNVTGVSKFVTVAGAYTPVFTLCFIVRGLGGQQEEGGVTSTEPRAKSSLRQETNFF